MKIIHCADVHLGSRISTLPKEISEVRRTEILNTFRRMVAYAAKNGIKVILLSGDVFDSDNPFKKDKDFFYSVVKNNPDIDFLYLRGNHDSESAGEESLPNLKLFSDAWTSYVYGEVTVTGIEINSGNATSLYSTLNLDKDCVNIVMLHGQTGSTAGKDIINLGKLRNKNIDYLALGHIHKYSADKLDDRGQYAYSGCLEGRGFDEAGERGFIVLDVTSKKITHTFIPFAERLITEAEADITGITDAYSAYLKIKDTISFDRKNIYRIYLTGAVDFKIGDLASDLEKYLSDKCLFIDVKDKTRKRIDIHAYDGDNSLRGEFVRSVYSSDLPEDDKLKIISYGLNALEGREPENL